MAEAQPTPAARRAPGRRPARAPGPRTLAIDIGGTGLKAGILDPAGQLVTDRARTDTVYPVAPTALVAALADLVAPLGDFDRVSAGFPGMVRKGVVLSAPHFVTVAGPGSKVRKDLVAAWDHFDLQGSIGTALGRPARLVNDADMQGAAVVQGTGLELVITLGTGVGTSIFSDGKLQAHLELAHHPLTKSGTYNDVLGDAARRKAGNARWNKRVRSAVAVLDQLVFFDACYIGGGNSRHVKGALPDRVTLVDNSAGVLGGIKVWEGMLD